MEKESKSASGAFSGNGVAAVMLIAAGVFFVREAPLQTTRPPNSEPRLEQRLALQDIDARLWQDPFGAVAKARVENAKKASLKPDANERAERAHTKLLADIETRVRRHDASTSTAPAGDPPRVEILAVMLPSGPHPESVESRRRTRYAVLAALNAGRLAPADTEHIGYFYPDAGGATQENGKPAPALDDPIPFEWFEPTGEPRSLGGRRRPPPMLVMWLQGDSFDGQPLARLKRLVDQFNPGEAKLPLHWSVLGPFDSGGLKDLIDEVAAPGKQTALPLRFYSPNATAPDDVLLKGQKDGAKGTSPNATAPDDVLLQGQKDVAKGTTVSDFLAARGVSLVRTIGDDARVADSLIAELALRGVYPDKLAPLPEVDDGAKEGPAVIADGGESASALRRRECMQRRADGSDPPGQIAVVAEWDTLYGRALRRQFMARRDKRGFCVERYNYVRGLDGDLTGSGGAASDAAVNARQGGSEKAAERRRDGTFLEVAEGQSQFDYLRRLALQMREQDRRLRQVSAEGQGLRAIGVLGNDVHDKLLVLQALRPEFPEAIFFTTDMDARFLHPREQAWARNLIVASSFGLRLADGPQAGAPPFRSSYQTSAFLATRLALEDARRPSAEQAPGDPAKALPMAQQSISRWFDAPRIFEIGRTGAFDFTGRPAAAYGADEAGVACRGIPLYECKDIHAPGSRRYPMPPRPVLALGLFLALLALWTPAALMAWNARDRSKEATEARAKVRAWVAGHKPLVAVLAAALVTAHIALPWLASGLWEPFAQLLTLGKPMLAFEGISLWPTEAIRLLTLVLSCYLLYWGWLSLSRNLDLITYEFDSTPTRGELERHQREADEGLRWWQKLADMFWPFPRENRHTGSEEKEERRKLAKLAEEHKMDEQALVFWNRHLVQNRMSARIVRTSVLVAIALLLSWIVMLVLGEHRFVPYRGELSLSVHDNLRRFAVVMMYFIVFFVVDATVFCVYFVRGLRRLRKDKANWPESTLQRFGAELRLPAAFLDNWIDLRFIAMRTRAVTGLIYCPFIVISLWLLSRSPLFDHWTLEAGVLVPAAGGAAVALVCAILLRRGAEKSRKHALEQVKDALIRVNASHTAAAADPDGRKQRTCRTFLNWLGCSSATRAPEREATDAQLRLLQTRIEALHEGAFAPLYQQPLLKAILLPFATLGGTSLFDYLALINL